MAEHVLLSAIHTQAMTHATLKTTGTLGGRLYFTEAPQDPANMTFPYGTYDDISGNPQWFMTTSGPGERSEFCRVQFTLWSKSTTRVEIDTLYQALKSKFDWQTFTVTGFTVRFCRRVLNQLFRDDKFWQYIVDYEIMLNSS